MRLKSELRQRFPKSCFRLTCLIHFAILEISTTNVVKSENHFYLHVQGTFIPDFGIF